MIERIVIKAYVLFSLSLFAAVFGVIIFDVVMVLRLLF